VPQERNLGTHLAAFTACETNPFFFLHVSFLVFLFDFHDSHGGILFVDQQKTRVFCGVNVVRVSV